ncbi:hypothetical protein [Cellulomonas aerilata]|uniref:Uncharacterized protein n=1 Tax=Cellulomonas aerilata TaxID=515326 RepID=A0A512DG36_9CELL|nr:hypothetical protein [Cellulomonas aerilata]GEO35449.1 hypothetical protein CAE01nite_31740 [Cellulomonas aerilata]
MLHRPELTAHAMLTQALHRSPVQRPGFVAVDLGLACVWLRARAARLLADAPEPHDLLRRAADAVDGSAGGSPGGWQRAAALEIVTGELAGQGAQVDPRTVQHLTRDPDGMLVALAELTACLYQLHDGDGAAAVVRALTPA